MIFNRKVEKKEEKKYTKNYTVQIDEEAQEIMKKFRYDGQKKAFVSYLIKNFAKYHPRTLQKIIDSGALNMQLVYEEMKGR